MRIFNTEFRTHRVTWSIGDYLRGPMPIILCICLSCRPPAIEREAPGLNEVTLGSAFRINLPEDHTTGYGWQLMSDFDKTLVQDISAVWHGKEKGIDFNFKARAIGQTTFNFVNRKYTDTAGIKFFVVKIVNN